MIFHCVFRYTCDDEDENKNILFLQECSALDPRFKSLSWLSPTQQEAVYARIIAINSAEMDVHHRTTHNQNRNATTAVSSQAASVVPQAT
jgi:hypothetical protein